MSSPGKGRLLPVLRGDCPTYRPCRYYTCRHHLLSNYKSNDFSTFGLDGDYVPEPGRETCSLDVADDGSHTLDEIAVKIGMSVSQTRTILQTALEKLSKYDFLKDLL